MPFWTVGDAGPYKEKSNFLTRTSLSGAFLYSSEEQNRNCRM